MHDSADVENDFHSEVARDDVRETGILRRFDNLLRDKLRLAYRRTSMNMTAEV